MMKMACGMFHSEATDLQPPFTGFSQTLNFLATIQKLIGFLVKFG